MRARFCNPLCKGIITIGELIFKVLVQLCCFAIWNYGQKASKVCEAPCKRQVHKRLLAVRKPKKAQVTKVNKRTVTKIPWKQLKKWWRRVYEDLNLISQITILVALACMCWILWGVESDARDPISISKSHICHMLGDSEKNSSKNHSSNFLGNWENNSQNDQGSSANSCQKCLSKMAI
jgi:hypothetical protein